MKRIEFLCLLSMIVVSVGAQTTNKPVTQSEEKIVPADVRAWRIDERLGVADSCAVDTAIVSYQDNQPINRYSIANSWNGNLGSPLQSKIYFDRTAKTNTFYSQPYDAYLITPQDVLFYNTKTPYAKLEYRSALPTFREEDYFKALFTMNANKSTNFGGLVNLIYGRGQYANQASRMLNGGFWGSYNGRHYSAQGVVMFNNFKNHESGGITDRNYVLDPTSLVGTADLNPSNIPVNLNAVSGYANNIYYFNHKYSIGIEKERTVSKDSVVMDYIPVTSFTHTIKFEDTYRRYVETDSVTSGFYNNNYYSGKFTQDSIRYWSLKNTVAVTMEEKFNRLMRFGLTGFVEYDLRRFGQFSDSVQANAYENHLKVGALIFKREGKAFTFDANGEIYLLGPRAGELAIFGGVQTIFPISAKDTMLISARGGFFNESCDYFSTTYFSNHFKWNADFKHDFRARIEGLVALPTRDISLGVKFENITNYVYFDTRALPAQYEGNIQVLSADLKANLHAWRFHLDNQVVYQLSSNQTILPLPELALYSNLYYKDTWFKVLHAQLGVSVRYHTAYYGNTYMPATGAFYLQNDYLVGNYPEMNVYLNFHLKRMRFYVQYANWNATVFGGNNYFSMPYYPQNPATFQFGLSWTFYD